MATKKRFFIVDGFNFFIRSYMINPTMDNNGNPVGGVVGFLVGLAKLIRENKPDAVFVVWDGEGGSIRRRSLFKDYKSGRKLKLNREYDYGESSEDQMKNFYNQFSLLENVIENIPIISLQVKGIEADDIIAYISSWILDENAEKIIVSSDKDFYQLVNENIIICSHAQKRYIDEAYIRTKFFTSPENFIYYKALVGDSSDNIKGVRGIGHKSIEKFFPIFLEKNLMPKDLYDYCDINAEKNKKYRDVIDNWELVINNIKLMQLSSPSFSSMITSKVKNKVNALDIKYKPASIRLELLKEGVALKSSDFFMVMQEQKFRTSKLI